MSEESKRVLIVDDSPDDIHFVMESFSQDYAVLAATNGEKALQIATRDPQPDVILMDVEMPGMNGYETCRRLKASEATRDIDVIFVSSHDTTEEKLAGYDAGGSDYLIKPVQPEVLRQKVQRIIADRDIRIAAAAETSSVMDMAMTAMSSAGELGVVINFMRESFSVDSGESLAELVVKATDSYGLESSVRIAMNGEAVYAGSKEPMPPLEKELLARTAGGSRIVEKGPRLILNFGEVTQLIKNLPADEDKRGRMRDNLAILLEGAEARAKALRMQKEMTDIVAESNLALVNIRDKEKLQKGEAMAIMDDLMHDMEEAFLTYGLTEEQETKLLGIVQKGVEKSLQNLEQGQDLDQQLKAIIERRWRMPRL